MVPLKTLTKLKKGKFNRHNAVFLTDNPELAGDYAQTDQERTGSDNLIIVSVDVTDLDLSKLRGDIDHSNIDDWKESLRETDQCMYLGDIPPHLLKIEEYKINI